MLDEGFTRVFAGAGAGLQDDGRAGFLGGLHDGLDLFEVVDVEGRNAVAVGGGVVQQFAHRDECHGKYLVGIEKDGKKRRRKVGRKLPRFYRAPLWDRADATPGATGTGAQLFFNFFRSATAWSTAPA
ncbi:hypothetical protein FQZ97_1196800 [compost metagenome]